LFLRHRTNGCGRLSAPSIDPDEARVIAKETYIYGFPMVMNKNQ